MRKFIPLFFILSLFLGGSNVWAEEPYPPTFFCSADSSWLTPHKLPTEVPGEQNPGGTSLCQFHQFVTEYFLSETYWNGGGSNPEFLSWMPVQGVFDDQGNVLSNPTPWGQQPKELKDICDLGGTPPPVITDLVNQAGQPRPLIDQNNNYTFYDVRMNKTQYDYTIACDLQGNKTCANHQPGIDPTRYPGGSIEIKIGWKILQGSDNPKNYISVPGWVKNPETGKCSSHTLGMVGYHLVIATPDHPEFIWGTFEHKGNNPPCEQLNTPVPAGGWSYYNKDCKDCSPGLNTYTQGKPTNVCIQHPQGGGTNENIRDIIFLNLSYDGILAGKNSPLSNYKFIGSIWTKDGKPPSNTSDQRGSLKLANSVAETYYQGTGGGPLLDCFSCHQYSDPNQALQVSHINEVTKAKSPSVRKNFFK